MDWRKMLFVAIGAAIITMPFPFEVKSAESGATPKSYEYTGTIKSKSQGVHRLTVQTSQGPIDFHYQRHGKRECAGFKELMMGDNVRVISPENKPLSEATCITKTGAAAAPR